MHFLEKKEINEIEVFFSYNISTLFALKPLTGIYLNDFIKAGGIKTYIWFEAKEGLFLLFKEEESYDELLFSQRNNSNFVEERVYGEHNVWEYRIPQELQKDFEKLKQGKYSELSNWYKKQYDKEIQLTPSRKEPSLQWRVFNKCPEFKEKMEKYIEHKIEEGQEIYTIISKQKETLEL